MDSALPVDVCGRTFTPSDLEWIRRLIQAEPDLCRSEIARRICKRLGWRSPDGRLKEMSCRVALLRLARRGRIKLPPPRQRNGHGRPLRAPRTLEAPSQPVVWPAGQLPGKTVRPVSSRRNSARWNEAISRFHYLGYKPLPGAQMRHVVESDLGLLGVIGFGASAWKVAARDDRIGWTAEQRVARLAQVVNNARFLILPWIRSANLASWVLAHVARRLPADWERRYGYRPVLLATFVEHGRSRGSCYRAADGQAVGCTQGRGKLDRCHDHAVAVKEVFLYPLQANFREVLCR